MVMMTATDAADLCLTDSDCDDETSSAVRRGRTCVRLYDGCLVGQCMCRSRYQTTIDNAGQCVDGKRRRLTLSLCPYPWRAALRIGA